MHPRPKQLLSWKKKTKQTPKQTNKQKQNNGSYSGDNNMQLIYFTALICTSPQNYKPQSNPVPPLPQIQSLNICQLIQNISLALWFLCELAEGGDVNHTGEGDSKRKTSHTVANSSLSVSLCMYRRLFSPHWRKPTWFEWLHSENDIWFTYRWGYDTRTHTHPSPPPPRPPCWCQGTAQLYCF